MLLICMHSNHSFQIPTRKRENERKFLRIYICLFGNIACFDVDMCIDVDVNFVPFLDFIEGELSRRYAVLICMQITIIL